MSKLVSRLTLAISLCLLTSSGSAWAETTDTVNYDDPNLAVSNDFVADNVSTCPKTLKGKALDNCLERLGLKSSEVAQAAPRIPDDAAPLTPRRTRSAR